MKIMLFFLSVVSLAFAEKQLLPQKMIPTQKLIWGEKGLVRKTGWMPLTLENRYRELDVRNKLFVAHKALGYVTLAEMLGAGIVGWQVFNGRDDLYPLHQGLIVATNITYFSGLSIALFSPPPMKNREGFGINAHKVLASIHLLGMITTDILGSAAEGNQNVRTAHKISAITTFVSLSLATIVINF